MKIKSRGALAISVRDVLTISARRRGVGGRGEGEKEEEKEEEEHACRFFFQLPVQRRREGKLRHLIWAWIYIGFDSR